VMDSAQYGRLHLGRCVRRNLGYIGCVVDALRLLDSRCSGQPHGCSVSIMDPRLRQLRPCPLDVTWHLHARYRCVRGQHLTCTIMNKFTTYSVTVIRSYTTTAAAAAAAADNDDDVAGNNNNNDDDDDDSNSCSNNKSTTT